MTLLQGVRPRIRKLVYREPAAIRDYDSALVAAVRAGKTKASKQLVALGQAIGRDGEQVAGDLDANLQVWQLEQRHEQARQARDQKTRHAELQQVVAEIESLSVEWTALKQRSAALNEKRIRLETAPFGDPSSAERLRRELNMLSGKLADEGHRLIDLFAPGAETTNQ